MNYWSFILMVRLRSHDCLGISIQPTEGSRLLLNCFKCHTVVRKTVEILYFKLTHIHAQCHTHTHINIFRSSTHEFTIQIFNHILMEIEGIPRVYPDQCQLCMRRKRTRRNVFYIFAMFIYFQFSRLPLFPRNKRFYWILHHELSNLAAQLNFVDLSVNLFSSSSFSYWESILLSYLIRIWYHNLSFGLFA